ncbi:hypothetical protein AHAS_Ahas04G0169400 [Arachis hypogaea]
MSETDPNSVLSDGLGPFHRRRRRPPARRCDRTIRASARAELRHEQGTASRGLTHQDDHRYGGSRNRRG